MVIEPTPRGLYCAAGDFYVDPWAPVPRAVITHAHGDHLRPGSASYLCAAPALPFLRLRLPAESSIASLAFGETTAIGGVGLSFHPAGHILGAAQVKVTHRGEVWVVSGDYKRAPDPTCPAFEPVPCHTFITEATFGLPVFRWDPVEQTIGEVLHWWEETAAAGRPAVLFAYALGKAQRLLAELALRTDRPVHVHGAIDELLEPYRAAGANLGRTVRATDAARGASFAGALVLAPVSARGTLWMRRFADHSAGFASGWMRLRGARRRRAYDRGFALSDHADWDALLQTVADTGARRVFVTHGQVHTLARYLSDRGIEALAWQTAYEGEAQD